MASLERVSREAAKTRSMLVPQVTAGPWCYLIALALQLTLVAAWISERRTWGERRRKVSNL